MEDGQALGSISRINAALGVSVSNFFLSYVGTFLRPLEFFSLALFVVFAFVAVNMTSKLERLMLVTAWHLVLTTLFNFLLGKIESGSFIFAEQLSWSIIVLLAAEQLGERVSLPGESRLFLSSSKYIFADVVSTAISHVYTGGQLTFVSILVVVYFGVSRFSFSAVLRDALTLTLFDALGNVFLQTSSIWGVKIIIAILLSFHQSGKHTFLDHLKEYSRWEAALQLVALTKEFQTYAMSASVVFLYFLNLSRIDSGILLAFHDVTLIFLFEVLYEGGNKFVNLLFFGNTVLPFLFTLFVLAFAQFKK
jgi:hypothetical protein